MPEASVHWSHVMNLISSQAANDLPEELETFVNSIYSYFVRSPKRWGMFKEIAADLEEIAYKIVRSSPTRWLSLEQSIKTILRQWNAL